jgi:hypothetical protein
MRHDEWVIIDAALNHYLSHLTETEEALAKAVALADIGWDIKDVEIKRAQLPLVHRELIDARSLYIDLSIENRHHG